MCRSVRQGGVGHQGQAAARWQHSDCHTRSLSHTHHHAEWLDSLIGEQECRPCRGASATPAATPAAASPATLRAGRRCRTPGSCVHRQVHAGGAVREPPAVVERALGCSRCLIPLPPVLDKVERLGLRCCPRRLRRLLLCRCCCLRCLLRRRPRRVRKLLLCHGWRCLRVWTPCRRSCRHRSLRLCCLWHLLLRHTTQACHPLLWQPRHWTGLRMLGHSHTFQHCLLLCWVHSCCCMLLRCPCSSRRCPGRRWRGLCAPLYSVLDFLSSSSTADQAQGVFRQGRRRRLGLKRRRRNCCRGPCLGAAGAGGAAGSCAPSLGAGAGCICCAVCSWYCGTRWLLRGCGRPRRSGLSSLLRWRAGCPAPASCLCHCCFLRAICHCCCCISRTSSPVTPPGGCGSQLSQGFLKVRSTALRHRPARQRPVSAPSGHDRPPPAARTGCLWQGYLRQARSCRP